MHLRTAKRLAAKYLENCEKVYGYSKHHPTTPWIDFEKNTNSRYTEDSHVEAEYIYYMNAIVIYYNNIKDAEHLARTILHEYQHYIQSPSWMTRYYNMGHNYSDHPYEIAAYKEEENWKLIA